MSYWKLSFVALALFGLMSTGCSKFPEECHNSKLLAADMTSKFTKMSSLAHQGDKEGYEKAKAEVDEVAKKMEAVKFSDDSGMARLVQTNTHEYAELVRTLTPSLDTLVEAAASHKASGEGERPTLSNVEGIPANHSSMLNVDIKAAQHSFEGRKCDG